MDPIPGVKPLAKSGYYIWRYNPNLGAAAFFLILFILTTCWNSWRMYKTKAWFATVFIIGGLVEIIGYGARAGCHNNTDRLIPYIIQSIMLLVAPSLFAASIYMTLGRIIRAVQGEKHSWISPRKLTKIFVTLDVLCFFIQGGGAGIMAGGDADRTKMGENIIIGGLVLQIIAFALFAVVAIIFHHRMALVPTTAAVGTSIPWQRCLWILYVNSALIMVRNIVRVVEYGQGNDGYLLSHEWTVYVLDGLLMFIVTIVFNIRNYDVSPRTYEVTPRTTYEASPPTSYVSPPTCNVSPPPYADPIDLSAAEKDQEKK